MKTIKGAQVDLKTSLQYLGLQFLFVIPEYFLTRIFIWSAENTPVVSRKLFPESCTIKKRGCRRSCNFFARKNLSVGLRVLWEQMAAGAPTGCYIRPTAPGLLFIRGSLAIMGGKGRISSDKLGTRSSMFGYVRIILVWGSYIARSKFL